MCNLNGKKNKRNAFTELKDKLTNAPFLVLPNFDKSFDIECDASGIEIGVVLMQEKTSIMLFSEKLNGAQLSYPTYGRNYMHLYELCKFGKKVC